MSFLPLSIDALSLLVVAYISDTAEYIAGLKTTGTTGTVTTFNTGAVFLFV